MCDSNCNFTQVSKAPDMGSGLRSWIISSHAGKGAMGGGG